MNKALLLFFKKMFECDESSFFPNSHLFSSPESLALPSVYP